MALLPVEEALARVLQGASPTAPQAVPLLDAHTCVLAQDVTAKRNQPPFNASAMDGYAVRASDLANIPTSLRVAGESQAGCGFAGTAKKGEAVRIFTGAPLPESTDTVVIQENTSREGNTVVIREAPRPGANVRTMGGDFREGQMLLTAGRQLDARAITLAASAGQAELTVRTKPRVAILATGDELVEPGTTPGPDQIVGSNTYGLAALVERAGGSPQLLGIAGDTREALDAKLQAASDADVLVTIGGASVGDRDLVRAALEARGMTLDFWKVAIRPGKPMLFGRMDSTRVLGLPGNPVSCLVAARVFLVPLLYRLLGRTDSPLVETIAVLAHGLEANGPRQHYMRAKCEPGKTNPPRVSVLSSQDSAHLTGLMAADVLIVRAPNAPAMNAGSEVSVLSLDF
ncbi:MAG: molybdopterin molybdotransferase MoeA [Hyphomicrobium sp.]